MPTAAPEREYDVAPDTTARRPAADVTEELAPQPEERPGKKRDGRPSAMPFLAADSADRMSSRGDADEERADVDDRETRDDLHGSLGNGYLAAGEPKPTTPAAKRAAFVQAKQAAKEKERSGEPEYAQTVKLDRPAAKGATAPAKEAPETAAKVSSLEGEKTKDEKAEDETRKTKDETTKDGKEKEKEGEPDEDVKGVADELKEEEKAEGEGAEEPEGAAGGGGAAAPAAASGIQASQAAVARLSGVSSELMQTTQAPVVFAPHVDEASPVARVVEEGVAKRQASEGLAAEFLAHNAHHTEALLSLSFTAPARITMAAEVAKAGVDAAVAQQIAAVNAAIGGARATAQAQAAGAKAAIEGQRAVSLVTITVATLGARIEVETLFATADAELTSIETSQKDSISASYRTWDPRFKAVGGEIGGEFKAIAAEMGRNWLSQRNGESSILDGPIHDNKLEARADAAKETAEAYEAEFEKTAVEQGGQIVAGQTEVLKYVTDSAAQAREGLTQHKDAIVEALDASSTNAIEQTNSTADQMIQSIDSTLRSTMLALAQQQVVQISRLNEYALGQKNAIDDQAGQAIAALLDGGSEAVSAFGRSMREFLDMAIAMPAPDGEELAPGLAEAQAQTDGLALTLLSQMEQGIAASEQGVMTGGVQAVESVNMLGQSAVEQAQATASGYVASVTSMRKQALEGFKNLREGHQKTAEDVKASAKEGFTAATTQLKEVFATLSTKTVENFENAREQMRSGLRGTKEKFLKDVKEQADKADAAVKPRWKSVLKWIVTIVVIVAVIALTIVSAGALGVVGTILLGAALGAAAGAVTTISHNLIDGDKAWHEGVGKAMVVGAVGGLFGGVGGALAGRVASVGLKFGLEIGIDAIGGVVGDLIVGNPITAQGILFGAAIGAGVGGGIGIAGALKGKIKIRPSVKPTISAPKPDINVGAPVGPKSKTRSFLEKTKILAKTPDFDVPATRPPPAKAVAEPGAAVPKAEAPAPKPAPAAKAAPDVGPPPKGVPDAAPPKAAPEAGAPGTKAAPEGPHAKADADAKGKSSAEPEPSAPRQSPDAPEPGVRARSKTGDGDHSVAVTQRGDIVTCSNCATLRNKYKQVLKDNPALERRLRDLELRAKTGDAKTVADDAARLEPTLKAIDKGKKPEINLGGKKVASKADLDDHLAAIAHSGKKLSVAERAYLTDLGERFAKQVNSGQVTKKMKDELESAFQKFGPQHVGSNPVLKEAWDRTMKDMAADPNYKKFLNADGTAKPGVSKQQMNELYASARGRINTHIKDVADEIETVFGTMKSKVTGLPENVEMHHLLYKSKVPEHAVTPENLMLALRNKVKGGKGELHDLLHYISAGAGKTMEGSNRWRTLVAEMEDVIRKVYKL